MRFSVMVVLVLVSSAHAQQIDVALWQVPAVQFGASGQRWWQHVGGANYSSLPSGVSHPVLGNTAYVWMKDTEDDDSVALWTFTFARVPALGFLQVVVDGPAGEYTFYIRYFSGATFSAVGRAHATPDPEDALDIETHPWGAYNWGISGDWSDIPTTTDVGGGEEEEDGELPTSPPIVPAENSGSPFGAFVSPGFVLSDPENPGSPLTYGTITPVPVNSWSFAMSQFSSLAAGNEEFATPSNSDAHTVAWSADWYRGVNGFPANPLKLFFDSLAIGFCTWAAFIRVLNETKK